MKTRVYLYEANHLLYSLMTYVASDEEIGPQPRKVEWLSDKKVACLSQRIFSISLDQLSLDDLSNYVFFTCLT